MADDWQETALSTRHMHNRQRGGRGAKGNSSSSKTDNSSAFDVRRMFGTYSLSCPKATPSPPSSAVPAVREGARGAGGKRGKRDDNSSSSGGSDGVLEIYRLTDDGRGLIGCFLLPLAAAGGSIGSGVEEQTSPDGKEVTPPETQSRISLLEATVVLTGSRKVMRHIIKEIEHEACDSSEGEAEKDRSKRKMTITKSDETGGDRNSEDDLEGEESLNDEQSEESDLESEQEDKDHRYRRPFEKNSFRSPKFWAEWRSTGSGSGIDPVGSVTTGDEIVSARPESRAEGNEKSNSILAGTGYLVFQGGNDCRKFSGTISCPDLGWNNLAMSGRKRASAKTRDTAVFWPRLAKIGAAVAAAASNQAPIESL
ncbi:hypothetical protein MN608_08973 [Microdochium nivale]|nr:hypothetical protein MN608_08973 [Microdochium nivale]